MTPAETIGPITTSDGTNVWITTRQASRDRILVLENPAAPKEIQIVEAGRIVRGGFQPASFASWAMRPEALRAVADLIEAEPA